MDERINRIEGGEQELIQLLRTSGLRKQRETFLIDKVLECRKERRQFTHDMSEAKNNAINDAARMKDELAKHANLSKALVDAEAETATLRASLSAMQQQAEAMLDRVKSKYQNKLHKLETTIRELENRRDMSEQQAFDERVRAVRAELETEIHAHYSSKADKYKSAMLKLSERERSLDTRLTDTENSLKSRDEECRCLKESLERYETLNNQLNKQVTDLSLKLNQSIEQLQQRDSKILELTNKLELDTRRQRRDAEQLINGLQQSHDSELARIDSKVRRIIEEKDEAIDRLVEKLKSSEAARKDVESALKDLNKKLAF